MDVCDPSLQGHSTRAGAARRGDRPAARVDRGCARGLARRRGAARRREGERPPGGAGEDGQAGRRRARRDSGAPGRGRLAHRRCPLTRSRPSVRVVPPRAMGRRGIPDEARRRRHPARRACARGRRRVRRDDLAAPVPRAPRGRRGGLRDRAVRGQRSSIHGSRRSSSRRTPPARSPLQTRSRSRSEARHRSQSEAQTSSFVVVRRITSSVNSVVPASPPRSAVRTPLATASRQPSRIARPAVCAASSSA